MLRVLGYSKQNNATAVMCSSDEAFPESDANIPYLLMDGLLESYMMAYDLPAGAALIMLLLDAFYEDITAPYADDPDLTSKANEIVDQADDRMEWHCDRNELLAAITVDPNDNPTSAASMWIRGIEDKKVQGEAHQRMQEERIADDFVSAMPKELRQLPKATEPTVPPGAPVSLAIQFVP